MDMNIIAKNKSGKGLTKDCYSIEQYDFLRNQLKLSYKCIEHNYIGQASLQKQSLDFIFWGLPSIFCRVKFLVKTHRI